MKYPFHLLVPVKEIEPEWFKLRWRPIRNGTYNLYVTNKMWRYRSMVPFGFRFYKSCAHNGWGRSYDGFNVEVGFFFCTVNFWIIYNIHCMRGGALDASPEQPLDFSKSKLQ